MCNVPLRCRFGVSGGNGWESACHALEELDEERRVGEVHLFGDSGDWFVGVLEVYLDAVTNEVTPKV